MKKQTTKMLNVLLTPAELLEIGKELTAKVKEIDRIESLKKKIPDLREEVSGLSNKFINGFDLRPVVCAIVFNSPRNGKKSIVREDTGEIVEVLNMEPEEFQEEFEMKEYEIVEEAKQLTEAKLPDGEDVN